MMKNAYITILLVGLCVLGSPLAAHAALDWHIRWDETNSPQTAKIYIFNPESTNQRFMLEIGDVAKTSFPEEAAPHLIIGQDVSRTLTPSERKIFDVIVYMDIDPHGIYDEKREGTTYQLTEYTYRTLGQKYDKPTSSRDYPYSVTRVAPVPREGEETDRKYTYRSGRGYWTIALADHDHILEQLIRTGERIGANHRSIQQAILFYTQGGRNLSDDALEVWESAFPEFAIVEDGQDGEPPVDGTCSHFVTLVASNVSYYSSARNVTIGDILAPKDPSLSPVVAAEDLNYSVSPGTQQTKRLLKVFLMKNIGRPLPEDEYVSIINHNSRIERVIRIGQAESYANCAIQDVIFYLNGVVATPTTGENLWERVGGGGNGTPVPTPTPSSPYPGARSVCLGNPSTQPGAQAGRSSNMTLKNLAVLFGVVLPVGFFFRRGRK